MKYQIVAQNYTNVYSALAAIRDDDYLGIFLMEDGHGEVEVGGRAMFR